MGWKDCTSTSLGLHHFVLTSRFSQSSYGLAGRSLTSCTLFVTSDLRTAMSHLPHSGLLHRFASFIFLRSNYPRIRILRQTASVVVRTFGARLGVCRMIQCNDWRQCVRLVINDRSTPFQASLLHYIMLYICTSCYFSHTHSYP